jgi:hypothetical protein
MSREIVFLPAVDTDFLEGSQYYEALSPGTGGTRFERAFRQALQRIEAGLTTHAMAFGQFHRTFLPRFPYTIYYKLAESRAVIIALLYARPDPEKIEQTLRHRTE